MPSRRKPLDLKIVSGTYRADRDGPKTQPEAPGFGDATPPDDLDEVGQAAWVQTITVLMKAQTLAAADRDAIHQYCQDRQRKAKYMATLATDGEIVTLPNGIQTIHPAVKLLAASERRMRDFQKRFGFDPTSRNQLSIRAGIAMSSSGPFTYLELFKIAPIDPTTITDALRERLIETVWFGMTDDAKRLAREILATDPGYQAMQAEKNKPKGLLTRDRSAS